MPGRVSIDAAALLGFLPQALTGSTDRLSTVDIIGRMCRGVAGVVDVVNEIAPDRDDTAELHHHNPMGATVRVMAP